MSIERRIVEKLNESRRIDEAFPPILNKLSKYDKELVRKALTKRGIDIENTPYEQVVITNGRDPRLKSDVVIFEFGRGVAVWFGGKFLSDIYVGPNYTNVSRMSWKNILEYATRIIAMKFDPDKANAMFKKQADRAEAKKGMVQRFTKKNAPRYAKLDKSGYVIEPGKYKKMLADLKIPNASKELQRAKEIYQKLAANIDKIDWATDNDFYNYDHVMKLFVTAFRDLSMKLAEYERYQKDSTRGDESDEWWLNNLKDKVSRSIEDLRDAISKAKKYM